MEDVLLLRPKRSQRRRQRAQAKYVFRMLHLEKILPQREETQSIRFWESSERAVSPLPRSGHRLVTDGASLYLLGGYNPNIEEEELLRNGGVVLAASAPLFLEVWKFNIARRVWKRLNFSGLMPPQLASHSAVMLPDNVHIVMYGGTGFPFGQNSSNALHVFNTEREEWAEVNCSDDTTAPDHLYGQGVATYKEKFITVGGTSGHSYSADIHAFDFELRSWKKLNRTSENDFLIERYRHEIVCHDDQILLFGGGTATTVKSLQLLDVFNIETKTWGIIRTRRDPEHGYPNDRRCHSVEKFDHYAFVIAGYNGMSIFPDIWRLNLNDYSWRLLKDRIPRPVYFHASTMTEEGRLFIFGGVVDIGRIDANVRTNELFSIWITIPKLKRLAFEAVIFSSRRRIHEFSSSALLELGIPSRYVHELQISALGA
ncbi:kelch domain-containing protein 10-like [Artemia franciscana]|uniref:Kelch repeat protein n=1 Tax=Artemia franciscana TaxID=6661 RepID=A0AA88H936_ARTSF|nr:hypothetical protein QYM36_018369 [Artemia franciscana]